MGLGSFVSKNKTSVLYDFSIVKKAEFHVFKKIGTTWTRDDVLGDIPNPLYAQINPTDIAAKSVMTELGEKFKGLAGEQKDENNVTNPNYKAESLSLQLIYDVYDDYMVGTCDGMLPTCKTTGNTDLTSETWTSLEAFRQLQRYKDIALLFKWGPNSFFGGMESFSAHYKAFSRFGEPLKAEATLTLKQIETHCLASGKTLEAQDNPADPDKVAIFETENALDISDMAEDVILRGAVASEIAGTELLGSVGSLRSFY